MSNWKSDLVVGLTIVLVIGTFGSCMHFNDKDSKAYRLEVKKLEIRRLELEQQGDR